MKKHLVLLCFFLSFPGFCQNIKPIQTAVGAINNFRNYTVKKIPNDYFTDVKNEITDNGQELEGYFKNSELKKIVHSVGLSNQEITTQFYFDNMKLIFVIRKNYQTIDSKGNYTDPKLISESRYYYVNGKMVKKIAEIDNKELPDFIKESESFINDLKKYK